MEERSYFGLPPVGVREILREIRRHMQFRQTIAAKIFGLAIILLLLSIALAGFLLDEVTRTTEDLTGGVRPPNIVGAQSAPLQTDAV